jgi:exopolyphosphatase / guanosine-5'-triphosphate,3'-diphosphate pyrophosphatase
MVHGVAARWEWRTFGGQFGEAEARFAALSPEHVQESDELYLLSLKSDASVKIREGLIDVKLLERVSTDGLEQWKPAIKEAFPLSADHVLAVMKALGMATAQLARAAYALDQLIDELVTPSADLRSVSLHKRRAHYTIADCMAELSEIHVNGVERRTICIESENAARVIAAVRELNLESRPNMSLERELEALVAHPARRYAVIDVGTNSVKFHIGEIRADNVWQTTVDRAAVTRLGEGFDETGQLGDEPIKRTIAAIADMAEDALRNDVESVSAVGTAVLRVAPNRSMLLDPVRERTGISIEVIDAEEEARLAYLAARSSLGIGSGSLVVFDTGGGSSQFSFDGNGRIDERFSVNVGAVAITERYALSGRVTEDRLESALDGIAGDLAVLDRRPTADSLIGMGGAVTNLAAVKLGLATYDPDAVHGTFLDLEEIDRQIELYRTHSAEERRGIIGLQPGRAEVILAGACIVRTILAKLGRKSFTVSDRGLRHGLLIERFGRAPA